MMVIVLFVMGDVLVLSMVMVVRVGVLTATSNECWCVRGWWFWCQYN